MSGFRHWNWAEEEPNSGGFCGVGVGGRGRGGSGRVRVRPSEGTEIRQRRSPPLLPSPSLPRAPSAHRLAALGRPWRHGALPRRPRARAAAHRDALLVQEGRGHRAGLAGGVVLAHLEGAAAHRGARHGVGVAEHAVAAVGRVRHGVAEAGGAHHAGEQLRAHHRAVGLPEPRDAEVVGAGAKHGLEGRLRRHAGGGRGDGRRGGGLRAGLGRGDGRRGGGLRADLGRGRGRHGGGLRAGLRRRRGRDGGRLGRRRGRDGGGGRLRRGRGRDGGGGRLHAGRGGGVLFRNRLL